MRICFISVGGFTLVAPYIRYFKAGGHEVHFIRLSPGLDYGAKSYDVGFGSKYSATEGKWKYPLSMVRARRLVRKIMPDIVHTHYVSSGGLAGVVCGFHPTITTIHGSDLNLGLNSRVWRPLLKMVFKQADCVNACTEDQKRKVVSLGISRDKIKVLTLGIDSELFTYKPWMYEKDSGPLRLISTRRLEDIYDHGTVIKALAIAKSKGVNFRMTFVADGSLYKQLKAEVDAANMSDRVTFLGGISKDAIVEILCKHDVFISSPIMDGISVALLEAMSVGLFPIASNISVNMDWLEDGVTGFLYQAGNSELLADRIIDFWKNPAIAGSAVISNRRKVEELADTCTNMKKLEIIYQGLIEKGN